MIRQQFSVKAYWKVIVYYNMDYNFFNKAAKELKRMGIIDTVMRSVFHELFTGRAKAVTFSNLSKHRSIVILNPHKSRKDFLNSIVHEAEHIKQAMLSTYRVRDAGEPPAYTIGYIVMKMYEAFKSLI